jgi:hypothetical protein
MKYCWLIIQLWNATLSYNRAQYRVSYYRKLKVKLKNSKKTSKWNNSTLTKKIESERLIALTKQKDLLDTKKRVQRPILAAKKKICIYADFTNGKVFIRYCFKEPGAPLHQFVWQYFDFDTDQIIEMADQYEIQCAFDKLFMVK